MFVRIVVTILFTGFVSSSFGQNGGEEMTNAKIIELARMGLSEAVIVAKINKSGCRCDTTTAAIGRLKAAKISDAIILAMVNTSDEAKPASPPKFTDTVISTPSRPTSNSNGSQASQSSSDDPSVTALRQISEPGIYLFENGKMTSIEPSVFSGTKANFLKGALTYGIMKTKFRAKVRGKSANMQVGSSQPVFYFVFNPEYQNSGATMAGNLWWGMPATSPAEFMMVQMAIKDASREAVMGEYGAFTGMSTGARDKDIREYSFEKIKTGIYKVVPKVPLTPGEYCFYYAGNVVGLGFAGGKVFDFSVK